MAAKSHVEEVEEQAALFALGALPPDEAAHFKQRLAAGCPLCQAEWRECQETVTALSRSASEVPPPPGLRARLLETISATEKTSIREGILVRSDQTAWVQSPVPGLELRPLLEKQTMLVRMAPKTWYPGHNHDAGEQCLVLEGSISSDGVTAYAGDFTYMPRGSTHRPLYSEDGCLLLIAYT